MSKLSTAAPEVPVRDEWRGWGSVLRRRRLDGIVAWLLETGAPLALVSAQILYAGVPFLGARAQQFARLLETDDELARCVGFLRATGDADATSRRGGS